jgi:hypothetical protein
MTVMRAAFLVVALLACRDKPQPANPTPSAPSPAPSPAPHAVIAGSCNWASVLSMCVDLVVKDPAVAARVLEQTGCKSYPTTTPCPTAAVVGSCEISEDGRKVEGRPIAEEIRRARTVLYRYYGEGPQPFTSVSARSACTREGGHWVAPNP